MCACSLAYSAHNLYVTSFVAPLSPPGFSALSHKRHDFREKDSEHKMCVLIFSTTFIQNISHSKKNSARYCHKCEKSSWKISINLVGFEWNLNFLNIFSKTAQISSFMKIRPVEDKLFHMDRRTDGHDKANSQFSERV